MLADSGYTIPIANHDLPPSESLLQTFDNLQSLNIAIDDVFRRIAVRINQERSKIGSLSSRVQLASKKISSIGSNSSQVCTIFSSAKYPSLEEAEDTTALSFINPPVIVSDHDLNLLSQPKLPKHIISKEMRAVRPQPVDTSSLFFELSSASANRAERSALGDKDSEAEGQEGLGKLPANLTSISSVLLFNSDVNPYKKYSSFNNLEGVSGIDRNKSSLDLFSAPRTIAEGSELPAFQGLQLDYRPDLGSVPTFQLPTSLPLSHLANISFGGNFASIAPSTGTISLPTLSFDGLPSTTPTVRGKGVASGVPSNYKDATLPVPTSNVPVSQVPTSQVPTSVPQSAPPVHAPPTTVPATMVPTSTPVPSQPVPVQEHIPAQPEVSSSQPQPAPGPKLPAIPAGRGGLLDAIKKGVSLKKKDDDDDSSPVSLKPTPAKPASGGLDLMSALKAGLDRRAAIMSGKDVEDIPKPKSGGGIGGGLDSKLQNRLSQMASNDDDDDDDDGDDDWD